MALAPDGSGHGSTSGTSTTASLTTSQTNDYIIAVVLTNDGPLASVSGSTLGAFTKIIGIGTSGNAGFTEEIWAKFSTGAVTGETITANCNGGGAFTTLDVFGVSGSGQTSLVWDSGGPQTSNATPSDPISITTANANTMVIAGFRVNTASPTAGSGFTAVSGANFGIAEYKVLSSTATTSCGMTTGSGGSNAGVVVAVVATGGGGGGSVAHRLTTLGVG